MVRSLKDDLETIEHLIEKCETSKLTMWELDFIDDLHTQLTSGRPLFGKQGETLDRIWMIVATEIR